MAAGAMEAVAAAAEAEEAAAEAVRGIAAAARWGEVERVKVPTEAPKAAVRHTSPP